MNVVAIIPDVSHDQIVDISAQRGRKNSNKHLILPALSRCVGSLCRLGNADLGGCPPRSCFVGSRNVFGYVQADIVPGSILRRASAAADLQSASALTPTASRHSAADGPRAVCPLLYVAGHIEQS